MCHNNSTLFLEVLRQIVCVLLYIVTCDIIRSSPCMFGSIMKSTEHAVHATPWTKGIRRERWNFVARCNIVNGYLVNRTEPADVCDHRSSESKYSSVTFAISVLLFLMSTGTVFAISIVIK